MKTVARSVMIWAIAGFLFPTSGFGQPYALAAGARLGTGSGIVAKGYLNTRFAVEGMALYQQAGLRLDVVGAYHQPLGGADRARVFVGGGPYGGFAGQADGHARAGVWGVAGLTGLEWNLPGLPVAMSLDWKPGWGHDGARRGWNWHQAGMSLRVWLH